MKWQYFEGYSLIHATNLYYSRNQSNQSSKKAKKIKNSRKSSLNNLPNYMNLGKQQFNSIFCLNVIACDCHKVDTLLWQIWFQ